MRNVGPDVPFETVVVLNGSPDPVRVLVREGVTGATVVESRVNRGVAGGYHLARRAAGGDLLVLLHDDVEVWPGWLEALVAAADECPEAGAIGSKVLNADGTLQAAGARIFPDGMTEAIGSGESADAYQERKVVDYSGSSSLLVRAATWDAVGGMDERFYPAYHVDVDLGMSVRAHGQVVLYEPRSRVTHHRWGMARDERFRVFAAYRNLARYVAKWHDGGLTQEFPASDLDYLRLEFELKSAYIRELERRLLIRLGAPSRRGSSPSADRS